MTSAQLVYLVLSGTGYAVFLAALVRLVARAFGSSGGVPGRRAPANSPGHGDAEMNEEQATSWSTSI